MKKISFLKPCILLQVILLFTGFQIFAQGPFRGPNQVAVTGWTDDTHYLMRNFDASKNLVTQSVDIKTGKSVIVPASKSERELFTESLPAGI
jgi:hypothetical protein